VLVEAGHATGARDRNARMARGRGRDDERYVREVAMSIMKGVSERSVDASQEGHTNLTRLFMS
jgi:hypothetical protein